MKKKLIIDNNTKLHISLILKYYRRQQHEKQFDFIQHQHRFICSADTYSRIENGKIIKRDTIYLELLQKLHLSYLYSPEDWKNMHTDFQLLLKYVYTYHIENLFIQCERIKEKLEDIKDFLAQEIIYLLEDIHSFYCYDGSIPEERYQKYCFIFAIFPIPLQTVLKHMLFEFICKTNRDFLEGHRLFQRLEIASSKDSLLQLVQANEFFYEKRYLESYAIALQLKQRFQKEHNVHRMIEVYELLTQLFRIVQHDCNATGIVDEFMAFYEAEYSRMSEATCSYAQFLKAQLYLAQKQTSIASNLFTQLCQCNISPYPLYAAIFLFHLNRMTQGTYETVHLHYNTTNATPCMKLYLYFIYKQEQPRTAEELELYMIKRILPHIHLVDPIFYTIVHSEMLYLIKATKHYYIKKKLKKVHK